MLGAAPKTGEAIQRQRTRKNEGVDCSKISSLGLVSPHQERGETSELISASLTARSTCDFRCLITSCINSYEAEPRMSRACAKFFRGAFFLLRRAVDGFGMI